MAAPTTSKNRTMMVMNDESFARLVADDVKNRISTPQKKYLELPENNERWQRALNVLISNLEEQLHQISLDLKADTQRYSDLGSVGDALLAGATSHYNLKKEKIERFKFYVSNRLSDIVVDSEHLVIKNGIDESILLKAIITHMNMNTRYNIAHTPIDEALYASLKGIWRFDDINPDDLVEFSDDAL